MFMKYIQNGLIILSLSVFGITLSVEQPKKCLPFIVGGQEVPLVYIKATDDPSKGGCCLQGNVYYANANNGGGQCCKAGSIPIEGGGCCPPGQNYIPAKQGCFTCPPGQIFSPDKKDCCVQGKGCCPTGTQWGKGWTMVEGTHVPGSGGCCPPGQNLVANWSPGTPPLCVAESLIESSSPEGNQ